MSPNYIISQICFDAYGRILSGTLKKSIDLQVLGKHCTIEEKEDMAVRQCTNIWLYESRFRIPINEAPNGSIVLIEDIYQTI